MAQAKPAARRQAVTGGGVPIGALATTQGGAGAPSFDFAAFYPKSSDRTIDELRLLKKKQLLQIASAAAAVAATGLTKENFQRLVKIAYDQRLVSPDDLARLGLSDRSSASRWISGVSAPNAATQTVVLQRIETMARFSADAI